MLVLFSGVQHFEQEIDVEMEEPKMYRRKYSS